MSDLLCVTIEDGKYTIKQDVSGRLHALRYGEEWRDLCGDGMVYAMAAEIERLRIEKANYSLESVLEFAEQDPTYREVLLPLFKRLNDLIDT